MKKRVCPCCDQPIKGIYCRECRKLVLHPVEQEVHYYLNERHPEFELDCSFHGNTTAEQPVSWVKAFVEDSRAGQRSSLERVRTAEDVMTRDETAAKKNEIRERMAARKREQEKILSSGARDVKFGASRFDASRPQYAGTGGDRAEKHAKNMAGLKWLILLPLMMFFVPFLFSILILLFNIL